MNDAATIVMEPRPFKFTAERFIELVHAGAFSFRPHVELLDGTLVEMSPQFSRHAGIKSRVFRRIADAVDRCLPGYEAIVEVSVEVPPDNVPEPDIIVSDFPLADRRAVPVETMRLVVEVADATVDYDMTTKARIYGAARIAEYWVVDIPGRAIHIFASLNVDGYDSRRSCDFGTSITAATIPGLTIETTGL